MNLNKIYESDIEEAALDWLAELGYTVFTRSRHRPGDTRCRTFLPTAK